MPREEDLNRSRYSAGNESQNQQRLGGSKSLRPSRSLNSPTASKSSSRLRKAPLSSLGGGPSLLMRAAKNTTLGSSAIENLDNSKVNSPENEGLSPQLQGNQPQEVAVAIAIPAIPVIAIGGVAIFIVIAAGYFSLQSEDAKGNKETFAQYTWDRLKDIAALTTQMAADIEAYLENKLEKVSSEVQKQLENIQNIQEKVKASLHQLYREAVQHIPGFDTRSAPRSQRHSGESAKKPDIPQQQGGFNNNSAPPSQRHSGENTKKPNIPKQQGGFDTGKERDASDYVLHAESGLSDRAKAAIRRFENIKRDPLGDVNSEAEHNHYSAARREAKGEIVATKRDDTPFDHIRELQEAYNGLDNVRKILEIELKELRPASPSLAQEFENRGKPILMKKRKEVRDVMNRLKNFLAEIGYPPPYPPFHKW